MTAAFVYTDAWHPTVNPSARMPIHHHRFVELIGTSGILNETPRRRGGSTLRLMRFDPGSGVKITALPSTVRWMPWWLPSSVSWAAGMVRGVYHAALADPQPTAAERVVYERVVDEFDARCAAGGEHTVGEMLHQVLDAEQRRIAPDIPMVELISVTRSASRSTLAGALATTHLEDTLGRWAEQENRPVWALGVGTSVDGAPLVLRFHAVTRIMELERLDCDGSTSPRDRPCRVTTADVATMILEGRLVPGSRLTAIAEICLAMHGWDVIHWGNTYQRLHQAARHLAVKDLGELGVTCWADDTDSWHYADLPTATGGRYPLHLLDVAACTEPAQQRVSHLIGTSLRSGQPVPLDPKESLDAALLD